MANHRTRRFGLVRLALLMAGGLAFLCLGGAAVAGLSNLTLPQSPTQLDRLEDVDLIRLSETIHLRQTQGFILDRLMPGWKDRIRAGQVSLENLLREAVQMLAPA